MSDQSAPPEGWYPVDDHTERYWNGEAWSDSTRPRFGARSAPPSQPQPSRPPQSLEPAQSSEPPQSSSPVAIAGVLSASVLGLFLAGQSASLMTGTGSIWTGVAIGLGAVIFAFVLKVRGWLKLIAVIAVLIGIASAVSVETALEEQRQEFNQIGE